MNVLSSTVKTVRGHPNIVRLAFCLISSAIVLTIGFSIKSLEARCALVVILMSTYWMLEVLPLAITALIPLVLYPMFGIADAKVVSTQYFKDTNVLVFGGLAFAVSIEHWNVHKRVALSTLKVFGTNKAMVMFTFMLIGWFLSMWISNTATTSMLVPIAVAVANEMNPSKNKSNGSKDLEMSNILPAGSTPVDEESEKVAASELNKFKNFKRALLLSVAYACSIGGTATITGTSPNALLLGNIEERYGKDTGFNFGTFFIYSLPGAIACLVIAFVVVYFLNVFEFSSSQPKTEKSSVFKEVVARQYRELGPWRAAEIIVVCSFVTLAFLWFFRSPKFIMGWCDLLGLDCMSDGSVVIMVLLFLFTCPSFASEQEDQTILTWNTLNRKMSWNMVLLLGGGFAMASGVESSGLDKVVMEALRKLDGFPPFFLLLAIVFAVGVLTEFTSNTSTASIVQPIMAALAEALGKNPFLFMIPTTLACSFAFCLPVATPPNAIAFSEGTLRIKDMVKCGIILNICCFTVTTLLAFSWGSVVFDMQNMPEWAAAHTAANSTV